MDRLTEFELVATIIDGSKVFNSLERISLDVIIVWFVKDGILWLCISETVGDVNIIKASSREWNIIMSHKS